MFGSVLPPSGPASPVGQAKVRMTLRDVRCLFAATLLAIALSACGGGGSTEGSGTEGNEGQASFQEFVGRNSSGVEGGQTAHLSDAEKNEASRRSREWASATMVTRDTLFPENAVTIPPLYFARAQAVAAAAFGTTLTRLRQALPAPSSDAVAAALMRGVSRTIGAGADLPVTVEFMNAVTAHGQPGTWATLTLKPLSEADLATERNLKLRVRDEYNADIAWSQATAFEGVFEHGGGYRIRSPMLRIVGPHRAVADDAMDVVALSLPKDRWLVRITPKASLRSWTADDLELALSKATGGHRCPVAGAADRWRIGAPSWV